MALELNGTTGVSLVQNGVITDANLPAGSVLQVVLATSTSSFSTSSTSYVTTGFSASITPLSSSSKILAFINGGNLDTWQSSDNIVYASLYRGASSLGFTDVFGYSSRTSAPMSFCYLDSPATTSSTTYTIYLKSGGAYTVYMNSRNETASITLLEIAA